MLNNAEFDTKNNFTDTDPDILNHGFDVVLDLQRLEFYSSGLFRKLVYLV